MTPGQIAALLPRRDEIVGKIDALLNAQRKPTEYLQDAAQLARDFEACFGASRLLEQLERAHDAEFRLRDIPGIHNGPADPAELMTRAFYMWQQTRWPGRNGRVRFAQTLFNLYVIRCLELLSLQLAPLQAILDELWKTNPADQPVLVKDARWLIPMAQSLATEDLGAYFEIAARVADTLSADDRLEVCRAGVLMAGGHLRSQIRYHATKKGASLDESAVVLSTRDTNALDFALLVQELVPLLDAYERADGDARFVLADAILQGISPDPELFLNRLDLLGPYSMIEHLFITTDAGGHAQYTPMGQRHVRLLAEYESRVARVATRLSEDAARFRPVAGSYSPYGVLYGFSADLIKHIALKASQPDASNRFTLEDVFSAGGADKLAWVSGWRKLPHLPREMEKLFEYPQQFADDIFSRLDQALRRRAAGEQSKTGRFVVAGDLPARYVRSDKDVPADRREGKFVVSYETAGGWAGITKSVLTEILAAGGDANIGNAPPAAIQVLKMMCPRLVIDSPP